MVYDVGSMFVSFPCSIIEYTTHGMIEIKKGRLYKPASNHK